MLKKTLAVLLACAMVCALAPMGAAQAFAAETETASVAATESAEAETVSEQEDDTSEEYETLAAGESKFVDVQTNGDVLFKITPDADAAYEFWSESNNLDTLAYLLDEDMYNLKRDDDGGENANFKLQYFLKGGQTYFLRVLMYGDKAGKFTVKAKTVPPAEGVSIDNGDKITAYVDTNFSLYASFVPEGSYGGELSWSSDSDVVILYSYNASGCYLKALKAGKAVVTVRTENGLEDSIEITVKEPEAIAESEVKSGSVEYYGQSFAYKFTPDENCRYRLAINSDIQNYMVYVKDENGENIIESDSGRNSEYNVTLEGGKTYTLVIRVGENHNKGDYSLSFEKIDHITDLKITKLPDRTTYIDGYYSFDYLDFTGLELEATWSDGEVESLTYDDDNPNKFREEYVSFSRSDKTVKINCAGAETSFEINVVPNNVESIEIANDPKMEFYEHTHGYWNTKYNPETDRYDLEYFYYNLDVEYYGNNYDLDDIKIKINYNDGTSRIAGLNEKVDGYYFRRYENQYDNPWTVGDNSIEIRYLDATASLNVKILETPVKEIELLGEPKQVIENSNGYWDTNYNYETGEDESFFYYDDLNFYNIPVRVHFKDGTTEEAEIGSRLNDYYIECTTHQYDKHFVLGSDNEVTISYMGFEKKVKFTIIENPVERIEILGTPKPIIENTNGYIEERYNYETEENEDFYYYNELNLYGVPVRVYYKDGTTKDAEIGDDVDDGYWIKYSTDQYEKPFTLGSDNKVKVSYMGAEAILNLTVIENPVESITVLDNFKINVIENVDGFITDRYNPETDNWDIEYFRYDLKNITEARIKINYKDGTSRIVHPYDEVDEETGVSFVNVSTNQNDNPWTVGGNNYATVSYMGAEVKVPAVVSPSPVKSIELVNASDKKFIENADGYESTDEDENTYFYYFIRGIEDAVIKINYTDGTSKTAHYGDSIDGYVVGCKADQQSKPWKLGSDNYVTIYFMDKETQMPVTVEESPVESITVDSVPTKQYILGDYFYGTKLYLNPLDYKGLKFTVNFKDGSKKTYTGEEIKNNMLDGHDLTIEAENPPKIGQVPVSLSYMAAKAQYNVTVKESDFASIEIIKLPEKPVFSEYYEPDWRGLQMKVTYKNGTSKIGTLKDGNIIHGYSNRLGLYTGFDFDGVIGVLTRRWIEYDKYSYRITLADVSCDIDGLTRRDDKRVTDVEVENFSESAQNMLLKVTNEDGSKEEIRLTKILFNDYPRSNQIRYVIAETDKGEMTLTIPNHEVLQTDVLLTVFGISVKEKKPDPEPGDKPIIGDANGDGVVDILDATLIQKYTVDKASLTDAQKYVADVNDDSIVDILDATDIQKYSVEKIKEFKKKE